MLTRTIALALSGALVALGGCSSESGSGPDDGQGASSGSADGGAINVGAATGVGSGSGGLGSSGAPTANGGIGGASAGGASGVGTAGVGGTGNTTAGAGGQAPTGPLALAALGANQTVGLEWNAQSGAEGYRVHYATGTTATLADPFFDTGPERITAVQRGLTNGTTYHYLITTLRGGTESAPSNEATATPQGEWVLEELGSGSFEDVSTGQPVPRVPLAQRVHVLLFAEGYTAANLAVLHDTASHSGNRANDVDRWVDEIFGIAPYSNFREAFVVWYLPRASTTNSAGGDTAFAVGVTGGAVSGVTATGETATRLWSAIALHPSPPTDFSGGGFGTVRTHVAALLMFDPARGRAGVSGLTTALRNPASTQQRIATAFGIGHAHEFTHAFSGLRDEYLEDDNSPPTNTSELSNVVASNVCGGLPWAHLLQGGAVNPGTAELVGAFGRATHGFHAELLCLLNGTHDNAVYYGGDGTLRSDDRMCNFCREITAYSIYARSSVLPITTAGFETWKSAYRNAYFQRFPFAVPAPVPQTNNVRNPAQGMAFYEACTAAELSLSYVQTSAAANVTPGGPRRSGCVIE